MNPEPAANQEPQQNPYDFILSSPPKQPHKGVPGLMSDPFISKLVFLIGGAIVLMVAAAVAVNLFFGSKTNFADLVAVAETQQEMVRVSGMYAAATDQNLINASVTVQASISTQQAAMVNFLKQHSHDVKPSVLAAKQNPQTDTKLATAKQNNNFDSVFAQTLRQELTAYTANLRTYYLNASGKQEKTLLANDFAQTQLLLKQLPGAPQ